MVISSASNFTPFSRFIVVCTAVPILDGQPGTGRGGGNLSGLVFEGSGITLGQDHSWALEVSCHVLLFWAGA